MTPTHLFDAPERKNERDEPCPLCGNAVRLKHSGHHSFWGCSQYPTCDYSQSLHETGDFDPQPLPEQCPECHSGLLLKKGRYGFFIGCSGFPNCHFMLDPPRQRQKRQQRLPVQSAKKGICNSGRINTGNNFTPAIATLNASMP